MTAAIDKCDCQMVAPASLAGNGSPTPRAACLLGDFFLVLLLGGLLLRRKPLLDRLRLFRISANCCSNAALSSTVKLTRDDISSMVFSNFC